jgi:hypothetical protein
LAISLPRHRRNEIRYSFNDCFWAMLRKRWNLLFQYDSTVRTSESTRDGRAPQIHSSV